MKLTIMIVLLGLATAACSSATETITENLSEELIEAAAENAEEGNVDIDIDGDDGTYSVSVDGDDDSGTFQAGTGATVPDGFSIPYPEGGTVILSMSQETSDGTTTSVTFQFGAGAYDSIVSFYDDYFPDDIQRFEVTGGTESVNWYSEDGSVSVTVTKTGDEAMLSLVANG